MFNIPEAIPKLRDAARDPGQHRSVPVPAPAGHRAKRRAQPGSAAPPGPQLAQIRSQNRRSPSGPGTRAARSHGSQPKQVIWLAAHAVCPEGPSAAAPAHLSVHGRLEAEQDHKYRALKGVEPSPGAGDTGVTPSIRPTSFQHCKLLRGLLPSAQNTPKRFRLTKSCCASSAVTLGSRTMEILRPMLPIKRGRQEVTFAISHSGGALP